MNNYSQKEFLSPFYTVYLAILGLGGLLSLFIVNSNGAEARDQIVFWIIATIPLSFLIGMFGGYKKAVNSYYGPTTFIKSAMYVTSMLAVIAGLFTVNYTVIYSVTAVLMISFCTSYYENKQIEGTGTVPIIPTISILLYLLISFMPFFIPESVTAWIGSLNIAIVAWIFGVIIFCILAYAAYDMPARLLNLIARVMGFLFCIFMFFIFIVLAQAFTNIENNPKTEEIFMKVLFCIVSISAIIVSFYPRLLFWKVLDWAEALEAKRKRSRAKQTKKRHHKKKVTP